MKSPAYWKKRAEARMDRGTMEAEKVLEQMERAYAKAAKELHGDIRRLYEKYGDEYGLSYADAIKYIDTSDFKEWRFTLAEYVERIRATGDVELLRELDTLATRARVTRLQTLETAIKVNTAELGKKGEELVTQLLSDTYESTYYRAAYDFQRGIGVGASLEMLSPGDVAKAISYPWSGADYSKRIWRNAEALTTALQDTITQGLIQGTDVRQMTAAIQGATGAGMYNAQRLVRTETAYMVEAAELRSYTDCGIEQYEILVSLDERTCKKCGPRDGQKHKVSDARAASNYPPFHTACRCTTVASFGDDDEGGLRFARDKSGKGIEVPANMTYNAWFDQYVKGDPEYLAKVKATQNKAADAVQHAEYVERLGGKYVPSPLDKFQSVKYGNANEWGVLKAQYQAMGFYDKAIGSELEITRQVTEVASELKVVPAGLEFRIKGKDSYLRKVRADYKAVGNSFEINDILRYTYVASPEVLADKTNESIELYANNGYNTVKVKNSWLDNKNPYKGINTVIASPGGQKFELQYHTQESFDLKNGPLHELYEKARVLDIDSEEAIDLQEQMAALSRKLSRPPRIEEVRNK